ncbi:hypothetical protein R3W88_003168 [Solanum pinnatisectum]|uniref:Uncharacterized protein n=1 Tax=Solanum pinnatisectum TaxID=50273 RepID=A0AAV9MNY3_9SOLN|nr:hypothetical protein R3W88_003168 [Solanum pinnatisectum]
MSLCITMFEVIIASPMPHKIRPLSALLLYASILVGKEEQDTYFACISVERKNNSSFQRSMAYSTAFMFSLVYTSSVHVNVHENDEYHVVRMYRALCVATHMELSLCLFK